MLIHNYKTASRVLINFCLDAVSELELSSSFAKFKAQRIDTSGYSA